ncbi:MAG: hypothetical protein FGM32_11940 [Candidatus Kapabacteria bacterium]|nr:hypothetical protein [Candidatus Kapabacteria bacterium]
MKHFVCLVLAMLSASFSSAQVSFSIGAAGALASMSMNIDCSNCRASSSGSPERFRSESGFSGVLGSEVYVRIPISVSMQFIGLLGLGTSSSNARWTLASDTLPTVNPATGEIGRSITNTTAAHDDRSQMITVGIGLEASSFSVIPFARVSFISSAELLALYRIIEPHDARFIGGPDVELLDSGKSKVLSRFRTERYSSPVVDVGLMTGYAFTHRLLGIETETTLQAFALTGVSTIFDDGAGRTVRRAYEFGGRLYFGVHL